jgi:glycolate oxidase
MDKLFSTETLAVMGDIRKAFNPDGRCAPHKLLPTAGGCGMEHIERSAPGRRAAM